MTEFSIFDEDGEDIADFIESEDDYQKQQDALRAAIQLYGAAGHLSLEPPSHIKHQLPGIWRLYMSAVTHPYFWRRQAGEPLTLKHKTGTNVFVMPVSILSMVSPQVRLLGQQSGRLLVRINL